MMAAWQLPKSTAKRRNGFWPMGESYDKWLRKLASEARC